jgi:bifunctional DNA-binding transcriptional regulator/antitoxin component of YhaV-PrlF toxin-antitoxin module
MLTELRAKSQITLPKTVVEKTGLSVGDFLDVYEMDGGIFMMPVAITPKKPAKAKTREEFIKIMSELCGSIDDPTMTEPPEIKYESPRDPIL